MSTTRRRTTIRALTGIVACAAAAVPSLATAASTEVGRFGFDELAVGTVLTEGSPVADTAGAPDQGVVKLSPTTSGQLTTVASPLTAGASALQFGAAGCVTGPTGQVTCAGLARVRVPDATRAFSPLTANFSVSAVVQLLAPVPLTHDGGMNVVQKGWGGTSDYWKLSVDYGRPQCVLKINGRSQLVKAERPMPLEVGVPYRIECARVGTAWTLTVTPLAADGTGTPEPSIRSPRSAAGNLDNFGTDPHVSIGSKGQTLNPDQLSNAIVDDVVFRVG
jgi:hypothetical protein